MPTSNPPFLLLPRGDSDRQWRLQRERLQNDFTKALNAFQAAQRTAAQKEKEVIKKAKASHAGLAGPGQQQGQGALLDLDGQQQAGGDPLASGQSKTQMMLQEEYDVAQLQGRREEEINFPAGKWSHY